MGQNIAILTHYKKPRKYVLYIEYYYSPKATPVTMVADFSYNGQVPEEDVHRRARDFGLKRAEALGVELVEKVEEDDH